MRADTDTVFYYRGHASAFGGSLKQPLVREISTRASASLPTAGGYQYVAEEKLNVDGLVSFDRAYVRVSGSKHINQVMEADGKYRSLSSWRTIVTSVIEGLNVFDVLTADRIVAQATVDHPEDRSALSTITLQTSRYENLLINGDLVLIDLEPDIFGQCPAEDRQKPVGPVQFDQLLRTARKQNEAWKAEPLTNRAFERLRRTNPGTDLEEKGSVLCSLVQNVGPSQHFESLGHMLHLPDFGNVFLGEMLVDTNSAQLTMLRVEMGCMAEGELSGGSVFSNGRTMP